MKGEKNMEPVEREKIQSKLFNCQCCNIENQFICEIRNEDMAGSMNAIIWVVGINPHCTSQEKEYFLNRFQSNEEIKNRFFEHWKKRAINYFNRNHDLFGVGLEMERVGKEEKTYTYYENIMHDFPSLRFGENCSHIDLYKIGTTNEHELKKAIKQSKGNIEKCPERFFLEQIKVKKPKLLILTGNRVKNWFIRRFKEELDKEDLLELKQGITKVPLKIFIWRRRTKEEFSLLFCPSFSGSARGAWGKKNSEKRSNFNKIIAKI